MRRLLLAATATLALAAGSAAAASYNAVFDFSAASNPSGPWSYGYGTPGSTFTALTDSTTAMNGIAGLQGWYSAGAPFGVPTVLANTNPFDIALIPGVFLPISSLQMHPGDSDDTAAILRFTAPAAGLYTYVLEVGSIDRNTSGIGVSTYVNAAPLMARTVIDFFSFVSNGGTLALQAGDVLSLAVDRDGNYLSDSTYVRMRLDSAPLVTVPEPASFAILALGLGCLGMVRRRA
ncbi:MAG: PEP-CTERM sorting domain-containing protein [Acetobacteraceae bacterium]|nr:PEP-CTERM sorting domain-containing protein [Acetobacteraceae bacterium]